MSKIVAKNIAANYVGIVGQMVIVFFMSPFLIHTLGDSRYGIWAIVSSFSGYMSLLDLGIASALTRYVARHFRKDEYQTINFYINSALFMFVIMAVIIIALATSIAGLLVDWLDVEHELRAVLRLLIVVISFDVALFVIAGVFRGIFGGLQRFEIINIARLGSALFKAIVWYVVLTQGNELVAMAIVSILANLLILTFYAIALKKMYGFTRFRVGMIRKENIANIFHFSKFVFVSMFTNQLMNHSGAVIVGILMSASAVTFFSIPWMLSEHMKYLSLAISRTFTPVFSGLDADQDMPRLYEAYLNATRVMLVVSSLLCIGMLSMGEAFIGIWIGEKYAIVAAPLILILFVSFYFYAPHLIGSSLLQGMGLNKRYAQATILVAICSVGLSVALGKEHGLVGVVLGLTIPQFLFTLLFVPWFISRLVFKRSLVEYWRETHLRTLGPAAVLYALLHFVQERWYPESFLVLFAEAVLCSLLYLVLAYFLTLKINEKQKVVAYLSNRMSGKRT